MDTLKRMIVAVALLSIPSVCSGEIVTGQVTKITDYAGIGMKVGDKFINNFPAKSKIRLYDTVTVEYKSRGQYNEFVKLIEIKKDTPTGESFPMTNLFAEGKNEGKWHVQVDPNCIGDCNSDLVVLSQQNGRNVFKKFGDKHITGHFEFDGKEIRMFDEKGQLLYGGKLLFKNNAWIMKIFGEKTTWTFVYAGSGAGIKRVE